jgi:hypothetical protein
MTSLDFSYAFRRRGNVMAADAVATLLEVPVESIKVTVEQV